MSASEALTIWMLSTPGRRPRSRRRRPSLSGDLGSCGSPIFTGRLGIVGQAGSERCILRL